MIYPTVLRQFQWIILDLGIQPRP